MNTVYDVSYFINKFSAIPEENWCTQVWFFNDRRCAFGHCGVTTGSELFSGEAASLIKVFGLSYTEVFHLNDFVTGEYQQPTPKQRILAALWDIKKLSYPELSETTVNDLIGEKDLHEKH